MKKVQNPDVIIAGAGIIGVTIALELRGRGAQVLVLDRGGPGQEASSAAAGMLAPSDPETPPALCPLAFESAKLFPAYVQQVEGLSQTTVDFRRRGTIAIFDEALPTGGLLERTHRRLSQREVLRMEQGLRLGRRQAYFVQEDSVDPALLMQAVLRAAAQMGVEVRGQSEVQEIRPRRNEFEVITAADRLSAPAVVNCKGAWSGAPVRARKGQMLYLQPRRTGMLDHVVHAPEVYLVPRSTGKVLVGATVEDVGYDKTVDKRVIGDLHRAASSLVPELAAATEVESWAGLRPGSPDDLPLIGETEPPGSFVASGHFRNGILLAPVTAQLLADLIMKRPPRLDISAFSPQRFAFSEIPKRSEGSL